MQRGLTAPLSVREESALRRIKAGITMMNFLPAREIERLKQLELVELRGRRAFLTRAGQQRAALLPAEIATTD